MSSTKARKRKVGIATAIIIALSITVVALGVYRYRMFTSIPEDVEVIEIEPTPPVEIKKTAPIIEEIVYVSPVIRLTPLGEFKVTAYCPCPKCCGAWADGITYTGSVATENSTIAVDPDVIPLGSYVEINGVSYYADDIGGAIKGNRIDIFFESHEAALEWGVQYHDVYLID